MLILTSFVLNMRTKFIGHEMKNSGDYLPPSMGESGRAPYNLKTLQPYNLTT